MDSVPQEGQVGRTAALGASHLFAGKVIASLIGLVGSLLVIRLLDAKSYGLISIAMVAPGLFQVFGDVGVSYAVIRFLAVARQSGSSYRSKIGTTLTFDILLGVLLTIGSLSLSGWINADLFRKPEAAQLAGLASLTVFAGTIYNGVWSIHIGLDSTRNNATMLITSYIVQTFVAPTLVLIGLGPAGAIYGYIFAPLSAAALGAFSLLSKSQVGRGTLQDLRQMMRFGLPLAGGAALAGIQGQLYNVLMATYASAEGIGNFAAATKFTVVMEIAMIPVTTVLFPAFAKLKDTENRKISESFRNSITYSSLLIVPLGMGAIVLSKQLTEVILGPSYSTAWLFLSLIAVNWLFAGFGVSLVNLLLAGQGETDLVFLLSGINAVVGGAIGFVLIPYLGVVGVPLASLFSGWPQYILGLRILWRKFGVRIPMRKIGRLFLASFLATLPSMVLSTTRLGGIWQIALGILSASLLYVILVPRLRVLDNEDLNNLTHSFSAVPVAGSLVVRILGILRRFLPKN